MTDYDNRYDALSDALKQLANTWALKARDHARESKTRNSNSDIQTSYYYRGIAETYYKLATELAEVLNQIATAEPPPVTEKASVPPFVFQEAASAPAAPKRATQEVTLPAPPDIPDVVYAPISLSEAANVLDYAGISAREVNRHKDNVFTAIFSRWQPFSPSERIEKMKKADMRIVILGSGKLKDTGDPYVEFAFKE